MRADDLASFLSILFDKHHVPPCRRAQMTGVVIGISRPNESVIRDVVPFFAGHFAGFAADADRRVGEETDLNMLLHVGVPALVRAMCSLANHKVARASGLRGCLGASETHALLFIALIL